MGRHNKHFFGTSHAGISRRPRAWDENAFVVLAEVNALARQGRDIISFCIGQPDFRRRATCRSGDPRDQVGQATATRRRRDRRAARGGGALPRAMRGGLPIRAEDVVVGEAREAFIAYAVCRPPDHGAGDEVIYPNPGFPIYESQIVASGAKPVPIPLREARRFAFDPTDLEKADYAKTRLLILNYPHNRRGGALQARAGRDRGILRGHPQVWVYADEIYSRLAYAGEFLLDRAGAGHVRRSIISDGASKTWAMTAGASASRRTRCSPRLHALDHQHRVVRLADQPVGRARGDHGPAGRRRGDEEELPRKARSHRPPLNEDLGFSCRCRRRFYVWPNVTEACRRTAPRIRRTSGGACSTRRRGGLADIHFGTRVAGEAARALLVCRLQAGDRDGGAAHGGLHPQEHQKSAMSEIWRPSVTVAAVIERDGRFLLVEERIDGRIRPEPAGGTSRSRRTAARRLQARGAGRDRAPLPSRRAWSASTAGITRRGA